MRNMCPRFFFQTSACLLGINSPQTSATGGACQMTPTPFGLRRRECEVPDRSRTLRKEHPPTSLDKLNAGSSPIWYKGAVDSFCSTAPACPLSYHCLTCYPGSCSLLSFSLDPLGYQLAPLPSHSPGHSRSFPSRTAPHPQVPSYC